MFSYSLLTFTASADLIKAIENPIELADQDLAQVSLGAPPRLPLAGVTPGPFGLDQVGGEGYVCFLFLFLCYLCFIRVLLMFSCCFRCLRQHNKWVGECPSSCL